MRRRRAAAGAFMLKQVYLTLEKCAGDCFNPFKACAHLSALAFRAHHIQMVLSPQSSKDISNREIEVVLTYF